MRLHIRFALIGAAVVTAATAMPAAYVLNGPAWGTRTVNYYINPANADLTEAAVEAAIQSGAATWGSQSAADFRFYYMGRTSGSSLVDNRKNEIFFRNTASGNLIAETFWWSYNGQLVDADVVFYDGGITFFTGPSGCSNGFYIEDTAAHEFGHALGLGHSADPDATMYYMQSWCTSTPRTLHTDDMAGVEALYPPIGAPVNTAPAVSISSPSNNASLTAGLAVTFSGTASDQQDGNLSSAISWSSSLSGPIGVGAAAQGALSAGVQTITASVTDSGGLKTTTQVNVSVVNAAPAPSPSVILLTATGTTGKNGPRTDLRWSGSRAVSVDVYRNGVRLTTTANDGQHTDAPGRRASGPYTYKVCDAGTATCSSGALVRF